MSEHDFFNSQGHHCQECWNHLGSNEFGFFCQLHDIDKAILVADGEVPIRVNFSKRHGYADPDVGVVLGLKGQGENIEQLVKELIHETLHLSALKSGGRTAYDALDNLTVGSRGTPHFPSQHEKTQCVLDVVKYLADECGWGREVPINLVKRIAADRGIPPEFADEVIERRRPG